MDEEEQQNYRDDQFVIADDARNILDNLHADDYDFLLDDQDPAAFTTDRGIQTLIDDSIAQTTTPNELMSADVDIDQMSGKVSANYIKTKVKKQIVKVLRQNDALSRMMDPEVLKSPELASHKKDVDLIDDIQKLDFNQEDYEAQVYNRIGKYSGTMSQSMSDQITSALTGGTAEQQIKAAKILEGIDQRFNYASKRLKDSLRNRANLINIVSAAGTPPLETIEKVNEMDRPLTKAMSEGLSNSIRDQKLLNRETVNAAVQDTIGGTSPEASAEYDKAYRAFFRGNAEAADMMARKVIKNRFSNSEFTDPNASVAKATPEAYVNQFLPKVPVQEVRSYLKDDINTQLKGISKVLDAAGVPEKPGFISSLLGTKTKGDYVGNKDVALAPIPGVSQTEGKFLVTVKDPTTNLYKPLYAQNNERVVYTVDPKVVQQKAVAQQQKEIDNIKAEAAKKRAEFIDREKRKATPGTVENIIKPERNFQDTDMPDIDFTPKKADRPGVVKSSKDLAESTSIPDTGGVNQTFGFSTGGI